jgi:large subunit ribosomal protein L21
MYAIVEIAGQQFKVVKDQKVFVHRLQTEEGKKVNFDNVLLLSDGDKVTVGAPAIGGAQVSAKVLKHLKGDKVIVFKKKRRKGYRVKNGHRQSLTEIQIESILASGAKKVTKAESEGAKPASVKTTAGKKAAPAKATKAAAPKATAPKVETKKATPKAKVETKPAVKKETATQDLSKMTVAELKEMAKAKGITGISSMKKADLIAALS